MKETKLNTPAEFSVQAQNITEEELDSVAGGTSAENGGSAPIVQVELETPGKIPGPKAYF